MKKTSKQTSILNSFLQNHANVQLLETSICNALKEKQSITITAVHKITGLDKSLIRIVLPFYTEKKRCRLELRCSWVEKKCWEMKAETLNKSVSEIATQAMTNVNIYVQQAQQLQQEVNEVISERVRFNNCIEQLTHWCLTAEESIPLTCVIAQLAELQQKFNQHDQKVMEYLRSKEALS